MSIADEILSLERAALDRWGKGDPGGCLELYAPDVTYFDPMVPRRVDGRAAMETYYAPVTGKISIDRFEYRNPHVKCNGDVAILTYNLVSHGSENTHWNVTTVYERNGEEWKIVHSHFSYTARATS